MKNKHEYYLERLRKSSKFEEDIDFQLFNDALDYLSEPVDEATLDLLLKCFHESEDHGVFYSLVHTIEKYPMDIYLNSFVRNSILISSKSPIWFNILILRIINSKQYRDLLVKKINWGSAVNKQFFIDYIINLNKEIINEADLSNNDLIARLQEMISKIEMSS